MCEKGCQQDRMTSAQRVAALLNGQPIDRVPFFSFTLGFCTRNVGYPIATIYDDPEKSFQAQLWTREMYGYDSDPFYGYASYGNWEFGGRIEFPSSELAQAPMISQFAVQSEEDIDRLGLPDVKTAGMLPLAMEFSKLQDKLGMPVSLTVGGVFTISGNICGVDRLCRWMLKKPEAVNRIIKLAADHILSVVGHWVETFGAGRVICQIWEPLATNQIISPKQFEEFILPHQKEVHEKILAMGVRHILCHICGDHNLNLPYWRQVPMGNPGIVSFGPEVDLTTAIEYFGDRCVIAGNLDPRVIQGGTPQQVYELSRRCIEKAKYAPRGFILMPGCELPPMAPPYNVYMVRKAVDDFGWYS